jgi:hypothetical protein
MSSTNKRRSLFQGFNDSFKNNIKINDNDTTEYYYVTDFENTTDKDCIKFDKMNEKIYLNNLKIFNNTNNKLSKLQTRLKLTDPPKPPKKPSNLENLYIWKQRNVKLNVYNQTVSILYLLSNNMKIKLDDNSEGIEPHDAINVAKDISNGKDMLNDVNIFLERLNLNTTLSESVIDNNFNGSMLNINNNNKTCYYPSLYQITATAPPPPTDPSQLKPTAPPYDN